MVLFQFGVSAFRYGEPEPGYGCRRYMGSRIPIQCRHYSLFKPYPRMATFRYSGFTGYRPVQRTLGPDHYGSRYDHKNEKVHPGYHQIFLDSYDINVELTSTTRVGLHQYTFPQSEQSHILFDFSTTLVPLIPNTGILR